jgi:hypothetical protein
MKYSTREDKDYLIEICEFDNLEGKNFSVLDGSKEDEENGVWTIFGENKKTKNRECLHVGSSKNIYKELRAILRLMISNPEKVSISTTFHKNVYDFTTYIDKNSIKYRMIYQNYKNFKIYKIDIERYLLGEKVGDYNKINYAEVKFAHDNKALLWNPAPPFYGNQEQKILREVSNKNKSV